MAITYVGAGAVVGGSGSQFENVPLPDGWQEGDLALILVGDEAVPTGTSTPTGWTLVTSNVSASLSMGVYLFARRLQAGDSSGGPSVDFGGSVAQHIARCVAFRGVSAAAAPWDVGAYNEGQASGGNPESTPAVTAAVENTMLVHLVFLHDNSAQAMSVSAWGGGLTEAFDDSVVTNVRLLIALAYGLQAASGSSDDKTFTPVGAGVISLAMSALVALHPEPVGNSMVVGG